MSWNKLFVTVLVVLIGINFAQGQIFGNRDKDDISVPKFKSSVLSYPMLERDSVKVEVNIDIPYNELQFVKEKDGFSAEYEATVLVLNEDKEQEFSKIWSQKVFVNKFEQTNSVKKFKKNELTFNLLPAKYFIKLGIRDVNSRKKQYNTKTYDYTDYYKEGIIISEMNINEIKKDKTVETHDIFQDSTEKKEKLYMMKYRLLSDGGFAKINYKITDLEDNVIFDRTYEKVLNDGISEQQFIFDAQNLQYKRYYLHVKLTLQDETVSRKKRFHIRWSGMNVYIRNINDAIDQLVYITDGKTMKRLKKAKGEEQKKLFLDFWKKKDPTPGTVKNELMNEYYSRVRYANRNFKGLPSGWKSDMGMIFILFGAPDNVSRHPFEVNSRPYEVWYYNNKGKVFYFIDETGFGEYRLANPSEVYY